MFRKHRRTKSIERRQLGARCLLEPLEPRILFSADPLSSSLDGLLPNTVSDNAITASEGVHQSSDSVEERLAVAAEADVTSQSSKQLVVIDTATPDYQRLLTDVTTDPSADYQVLILSGNQNGVTQISQYLNAYDDKNFSAIHVISHADSGSVQLGNLTLNQTTLEGARDELISWGASLSSGGDVLFYGCNLAQSEDGRALLKSIAELTGADVAGSDDLTGASLLNADWDLEFTVGQVESTLSISTQFQSAWQHTLGPFGGVDALWLNSKDGATGLSIPGIPSISKAELLEFSDPNLSFEPAGTPSQTTDGTFSSIIDMNLFDLTNGDIKIDAMHYVSADITIGQSTTVDLKAGDILMSSGGGAETLTSNNVQDVEKGDVFVFRPTVVNDYTSGDFFILFDNMVKDLHAISLVESDTVVGGTNLAKGSLIYSQSKDGSLDDKSIYVFSPIDVGESNTSGVHNLLIAGAEVGISENIHGLELIETNITLGGSALSAGSILISQNNGDVIGSNNLNVASGDIALLKITQSTVEGASPITAEASAVLFFDGADVGLAGVKFDGIALVNVAQNSEPVVSSNPLNPTFVEDGGAVAVFSSTSIDVIDAGQNVKGISLVIDDVVDGANEQIIIDGSIIELIDGGSGTTSGQGFSYEVSLNGASYTLVLKNGNISVAAAEAMIDGLGYNNADQAPGVNARTITLKSLTDTGGIANGGDDTVDLNISSTLTVVSVNDAPIADATALNLSFSEGGAPSSLFSGADIQVIEAGQLITAMTFTVTNIENLSSERLRLDGSDLVLVDGQSGSTATNSLSFSVSVIANTATISLSGGAMSESEANALLNSSAYLNLAQAPVTGVKTITLTEVVDSGGTANGGVNSGSFVLASSVTVVEINDEPVVSGLGRDPTFVAGGSAVNPFNSLSIDLIEADQLVAGFVIQVSNVVDGSNEKIIIDGSNIILIGSSNGTTSGSGFDYDVAVAGTTRTITFSGGAATPAAVESLLNNMTYQNDSGSLTPGVRAITLTELSDNGGTANTGDDTVALSISSAISVITVNAEPTFVSTPSNPTFIATGGAVQAFESTMIDTQDSGQTVSGLTLSISGLVDGADEKLVVDGSIVSLVDGASGVTADNSVSYSVSEAGGTATITLSGANLSQLQAQSLVDDLSYVNDAAIPTAGARLVELTRLIDSGGTANGGDDTVEVSIQSSIDVQNVNLEPSVNANPEDPSFVEGAGAVSLYTAVNIDLIETGQEIISFAFSVANVFDGADEIISFDGTDIALVTPNIATTLDNNISYLVTVSGDFVTLSFNHSGLSPALTESLILAMSYNNLSDDPNTSDREVTLTHVQDNGGVANGGDDIANPNIISTVTVAKVNDQPSVSPVTINAAEDGVLINANFLVVDADASDTHVFTLVGLPSEGSVINNNDGTFSFDPGADFQDLALGESRDVSFTYRATDNSGAGNSDSGLATVTVTVAGANDQPVAGAFSISANEDGGSVNGSFIETDADTNDTHVFSITSMPAEGSVINNNDGTFTFDPGGDFQDLAEGATRMVSFDYTVTDDAGTGNSNSIAATVTITVTGKNETPVVGDFSIAANEDGGLVNGSFSVADGDGADTHTFVIVAAPSEGGVINNNDGTFSFDPGADFQDLSEGEIREVTFTYRATDSSSASNDTSMLGTVRVEVTGSNDRPIVSSFVINSVEDGSATNSSFSVSDVDGLDTQTIVILTAPSEGNVVNNNDGTFTFNPGVDFQDLAQGESRNVSVTYQSTDDSGAGNNSSGIETITFTVAGTNDRPTVAAITLGATEDGAMALGSFNVADADSSDTHGFVITTLPAEGVVINNGDGTFHFDVGSDFQRLAHGESTSTTFTFAAVDSSGVASATSKNGLVTVTVMGTNDRPVVHDMSISMNVSDAELIDTFDFTEIDLSDKHNITVLTQPSEGTLIDLGNGSFKFLPGEDFDELSFGDSATVNATFQVLDDSGQSNDVSGVGTISIEVKGDSFLIIDPVAPPVTAPETPSTPTVEEPSPNNSEAEPSEPESNEPEQPQDDSGAEQPNEERGGNFEGDEVGERLNDVARSENSDSLFGGAFTDLSVRVTSTDVVQNTTIFDRVDTNLTGALSIESVETLRVKFALYSDPLSLVETERYMRGIDDIRDELERSSQGRDTAMGGVFSVTAGISAGYVVWLARSGILLSSVLSSLPAWRFIDPLPVLSGAQTDGVDDDESLEEMVSSTADDEQSSDEGEP